MRTGWLARLARLAGGCALLVSVSCAAWPDDPAGRARVHVVRNGQLPGRDALPLRLQPFTEPRLAELAAREHLAAVVAGIPREFDQLVRVQDWVNAQWPDGTPDPYPPWNALTVLDWIRSGKTGGFCAQYSQVFLQSLAALGYSARYIEIGSRDNPYAHYLTEVWSNDYDKWVVMDADYNLHFERQGIPLSAQEVHDALVASALGDVVTMAGTARGGHATPAMWPQRTAELYYYLRYHLHAAHLSRPELAPFDRFDDMIEFDDPAVPAWESSPVTSVFPKVRLTRRRIRDARLAAAPLNQVQLSLRSVAGAFVTLDLRDNVLQRDRYEYRVSAAGGAAGPWLPTRARTVTLRMPEGGGTAEVRGVNIRGVSGPASTLTFDPR